MVEAQLKARTYSYSMDKPAPNSIPVSVLLLLPSPAACRTPSLNELFIKVRFIEDQVHGATGSGVGAFIIVPGTGYESSSGGPFFRGTSRIY